MNRNKKLLLSVMIVSLSALIVPLQGYSENIKTEPMAVQIDVKSIENREEKFL